MLSPLLWGYKSVGFFLQHCSEGRDTDSWKQGIEMRAKDSRFAGLPLLSTFFCLLELAHKLPPSLVDEWTLVAPENRREQSPTVRALFFLRVLSMNFWRRQYERIPQRQVCLLMTGVTNSVSKWILPSSVFSATSFAALSVQLPPGHLLMEFFSASPSRTPQSRHAGAVF